jgi:hypothetical protein
VTIDQGFSPEMRTARGSSASAGRFHIDQWLSLTMTSLAPPLEAPSMAAFASPTISATAAS